MTMFILDLPWHRKISSTFFLAPANEQKKMKRAEIKWYTFFCTKGRSRNNNTNINNNNHNKNNNNINNNNNHHHHHPINIPLISRIIMVLLVSIRPNPMAPHRAPRQQLGTGARQQLPGTQVTTTEGSSLGTGYRFCL